MKLISWNVNGLRAVSQKHGFWDWFAGTGADFLAFQETKAAPEQLGDDLLNPGGYLSYWSSSRVKPGYSGVVTYARPAPTETREELPDPAFQGEGRLIRLTTPAFHFLNVYFPNGQRDEARLNYKMGFYEAFLAYAEDLRRDRPVVVCGDFNTAHKPVDLARPRENETVSGFLPLERAWLDTFVASGYVDAFRLVNGEVGGAYSWWAMRSRARDRNIGWRLDYFFVSAELAGAVKGAWLEPATTGSDHCPVGLELEV